MSLEAFYFDARYIRVSHHDGISRFSVGLFAAISKLTSVTAIISDLRQLEKLPSGTKWVMLNDPTSISEPLIAYKLNRLGAKVVFSPMQTIGSFGRKFKLAVTLHDLIYYRHPTPPPSFNLAIRILWRLYHLSYWPQRLLLNRSDVVITVSKATKKLITLHKLTRKRTEVVYNAASSLVELQRLATPGSRPAEKQTLVYMGSFMPYKNVETLIAATGQLQSFELQLLSKIDDARRAELQSLADSFGAKVTFFNGVSDEQYDQLLNQAVALVSASKDEGFGIPLVEAMARGIPVVVSNIDIFKEIGGDAAIFCSPEGPDDFAEGIRSLQGNDAWLAKSAAAKAQAKKFTWDESAAKLYRVLTEL
ncbi:glycosyltransferase family 1 protein [Rhodoluna sp.]|uniref:glycosyltransferase family 4 protein n=1 Tax=Rhodoluna sp. TaxID=1969481 RepID=UPI0025D20DEA|nr:glycosyltransferase family 1 protein [Rhodoluna sp.]